MSGMRAHLMLVVAVAVVGTAACIGGRPSPATRHYLLTPVINSSSDGVTPRTTSFVVGVGPVSLPAYLDRPQIVMRTAPDQIQLLEFAQWGEPLRPGVTRVLTVNLGRLMPESRVVAFPWSTGEEIRYQIVVDIGQLDGPAGGSVTVDAGWRVLDRSGNELTARSSRVSEPVRDDATTATAMSRALGVLSDDIARQLRATERSRP